MKQAAWLSVMLLSSLFFSGCADNDDGPTKQELANMISPTRGAIAGKIIDRNNRTLSDIDVKLRLTNTNELMGEVVTGPKGTFYFRQLFPTQYRITIDLKDWTECIVNVQANRFSNLTIAQPVYPSRPRSC